MQKLRLAVLVSLAFLLGVPTIDARPTIKLPRPPHGYVSIVGDGWVRVPGQDLKKIGIKATSIAVSRRGRMVPSLADGEDLVFLALGTAGPHTRRAIFQLHPPPPGPALPASVRVEEDKAPPAPTTTVDFRRYAADRMHGPVPASRHAVYGGNVPSWFLSAMLKGAAATLDLASIVGDASGPQQVSVRIYGTHIGKTVLRARWGEEDLGLAEAPTAAGGATLTWRIPEMGDTTKLVLEDESPPPPPAPRNDVTRYRGGIWIDAVDLLGAVAVPPSVGSDAFVELDVEHEDGVTIDDKPRFAVVIDRNGAPRGGPVKVAQAGRLRMLGIGRLCLGPGTRAGKVRGPRPSATNPLVAAATAEHVILSTPPLVQEAERLARHRTATGTKSVVVPVLDVYDHYAGGEHVPQAIRKFVLDLMRDGDLRYFLIAGDATYDRTDLAPLVTIPSPMARTKYNGATSADRLYTMPQHNGGVGGPAQGRLPFRTAAQMKSYVDRVIRYETKRRPDPTRNLMQFVTSEGRFGALVDRMLEGAFRKVLSEEIDPAYDIEVTFASKTSPFLWPPPEFNKKVIDVFNAGSLFFTYVGHGFAKGFDTLRVGGEYFPILNMDHLDQVQVRGTPPVVLVLACTTAQFDAMEDGVGEALLKRDGGPIAFWGATRICHPGSNTLVGRALAEYMSRDAHSARLGDVLSSARDLAINPKLAPGTFNKLILAGINMSIVGEETSIQELAVQSGYMFTLLGDPALRLAVPKNDLGVSATVDTTGVVVRVKGPLPNGTKATVQLEYPRNQNPIRPTAVRNPLDPAEFGTIRANHRGMNDRVIARAQATFQEGECQVTLAHDPVQPGWVVKVLAISEDDVHHGAAILR